MKQSAKDKIKLSHTSGPAFSMGKTKWTVIVNILGQIAPIAKLENGAILAIFDFD